MRFYSKIFSDTKDVPLGAGGDNHLVTEVNGWDIGVHVEMIMTYDGEEKLTVYMTEGSNNNRRIKTLLEINGDGNVTNRMG